MGITYSLTEMMSSSLSGETVEEKRPDGTVLITKRRNPWVAGAVVLSSAVLLALVVDGGNGALTKIFTKSAEKATKAALPSSA
ncbi:Hypothetical protein HVR_LOCUS455 [uncultured virus]|nr:Hypothetical protein HVR_LOCUS455 [uncultured virus]